MFYKEAAYENVINGFPVPYPNRENVENIGEDFSQK
jgi:hypothetical protein